MNNILVVDDEETTRSNIKQLLSRSGYNVFTADCGAAGFDMAKEIKPDLIISDIIMPGMNGYDLLKKLSDGIITRSIPLIFLTAMVDTKDILEGMNSGAYDYITKPFKAKNLLVAVENCLKKSGNKNR